MSRRGVRMPAWLSCIKTCCTSQRLCRVEIKQVGKHKNKKRAQQHLIFFSSHVVHLHLNTSSHRYPTGIAA